MRVSSNSEKFQKIPKISKTSKKFQKFPKDSKKIQKLFFFRADDSEVLPLTKSIVSSFGYILFYSSRPQDQEPGGQAAKFTF